MATSPEKSIGGGDPRGNGDGSPLALFAATGRTGNVPSDRENTKLMIHPDWEQEILSGAQRFYSWC